MKPEPDPYEISIIRQAADIVGRQNGRSITISPTHYALKVFPRDESELNALIIDDNLKINYIPFNYSLVPLKDQEKIERQSIIDTCYFQSESKYFIDYGEGNTPLPVLYLAWPVNKPLPLNYDYQIEYEAFIPESTEDDPLVNRIEQEAINISMTSRGSSYRTITGRILDDDDLLVNFVNVKNLRLRLQYGLSTLETYTDQNGCFSFTGNINDNASLQIFFENSKWRISKNSLFSWTVGLGKVSELWTSSGQHVEYLNHEALTIHRAANFFYNGGHGITTPESSYSLRINMKTQDRIGYFQSSPIASPCIHISNNTTNNHEGKIFANVVHELGHFNQYQVLGGHSAFSAVHKTLRESFACYVSWYLSPLYYTEADFGNFDPGWDNTFEQNFQTWGLNWVSSAIDYTPIFIDLADSYNQWETNHSYIKDSVFDTPHWYIYSVAVDKQSWAELRVALKNYIEACYSTSVFNDYVAIYDIYFANN